MTEVLVAFISFVSLVAAWAFIPTRPESEAAENMRTVSAVG